MPRMCIVFQLFFALRIEYITRTENVCVRKREKKSEREFSTVKIKVKY